MINSTHRMNRPTRFLIFFLTALLALSGVTGRTQMKARRLTLEDAISIAKDQSPDVLNARQQFRASYWDYRKFRGAYLPQVNLGATMPDLNRSINKIYYNKVEMYDLSYSIDYMADLNLNQRVGFTGGTFFIGSGLKRLDTFAPDTTSYVSTPFNIGYTQPIFKFNSYRWERKIQPMKYEEAKKKLLENIEQVNIVATNYFFDLLEAQVEKKIAMTNLLNYDTLYRIAKGRFELGKIAENDKLKLELNLLKAEAALENADLGLDNALFRFKSFLRIKDTIPIDLLPPSYIDFKRVDPNLAMDKALANSSSVISMKRKLLEAERDVRQAKMDNRFDADLTASFGYTQTANEIRDVYKNPLDQQRVTLTVIIPILDWGISRGTIKIAESQAEITKNSVEQERIDFERSIYLKVMQFNMQKNQLKIAAKSDTVAKKTYEVTKGRYLIGRANDVTDLNNAQIDMDSSEKSYYSTLQTYWISYFELRKLTLFDFERNQPLQFDFSAIH
jgi:outer membrane protein